MCCACGPVAVGGEVIGRLLVRGVERRPGVRLDVVGMCDLEVHGSCVGTTLSQPSDFFSDVAEVCASAR